MAQFKDFHGWDLHATWDDFKFGRKHYADFDRSQWWATASGRSGWPTICKPFTNAKVKYFDASEVDDAWEWVREGVMAG